MKFFSRWLVFGVTGLTIAWLTSIAFATGTDAARTQRSPPARRSRST